MFSTRRDQRVTAAGSVSSLRGRAGCPGAKDTVKRSSGCETPFPRALMYDSLRVQLPVEAGAPEVHVVPVKGQGRRRRNPTHVLLSLIGVPASLPFTPYPLERLKGLTLSLQARRFIRCRMPAG